MSSPNWLQGFVRAIVLCGLLFVTPALCAAHEEREAHADNSGRDGRETRDAESHGADDLRGNGHGGDDNRGKGRSSDAGIRESRAPRIEFERDSRGDERIRSELLVIGSPREVSQISRAGFVVVEQRPLSAGAEILARVRVGSGTTVERALRDLQALVPEASVAPHHLFRPAGPLPGTAAVVSKESSAPASADAALLGMIDTGVAPVSPALARALVRTESFAPGGYVPRAHGTVVADVAAGTGALLCSADVFGLDIKNELAAPTAALVAAIDWMAARGVRVLNISIEGPDNLVLAHEIRRVLAGGMMIVAAAGNDGPAAQPAYPGAYPGVIAVTAVDQEGRVYRRANRGAYIAFAARGVNIPSPAASLAPASFSGTSFAAPLVAGLLLQRRTQYPKESPADALGALRLASRDLGAAGRDEIYGWGELTTTNRPSF